VIVIVGIEFAAVVFDLIEIGVVVSYSSDMLVVGIAYDNNLVVKVVGIHMAIW
jgi:hypothetical protein